MNPLLSGCSDSSVDLIDQICDAFEQSWRNRARQVSLDRVVALKMILSGAHADAEQRGRFRREAESAARLRHPNVVQVHEVGEAGGLPFLAMEYVEGPSLGQWLADRHARVSV